MDKLDLNAILKAAGASVIQRRPEHANLVEYRVQARHICEDGSYLGWETWDDWSNPSTFVDCKRWIAELIPANPNYRYRIVAIVEVK